MRYLIRNDIDSAYTILVKRLATAIATHTDYDVHIIDDSAQVNQMPQLPLPVISLDKRIPGEHNLRVSRLFKSYLLDSDAQTLPVDIIARPGCKPLSQQVTEIPPGHYVLADDDSATGFTLTRTKTLLAQHDIFVEEVYLHSKHLEEGYIDIIDASDFIYPQDNNGGLVVGINGIHQRQGYLSEHVNLETRAMLPNHLKPILKQVVGD